MHEKLDRALYHRRRYLSHLSNEDLHLRAGYIISNIIFISNRHRYSLNNMHLRYWRKKLAHTAEELALRDCVENIKPDVLRHMPSLGIYVPKPDALRHDTKRMAFFRYDQLKYLQRLRSSGEILLRCASTDNLTTDFARNDKNELCSRVFLPIDDLQIDLSEDIKPLSPHSKYIEIMLQQKADFYMFCLSRIYDWRLFKDFNSDVEAHNRDDRIACLVITNPEEFRNRFFAAAAKLPQSTFPGQPPGLDIMGNQAFYYDPHDASECARLFDTAAIMPFAKRWEYTYQQEFRFVIRPDFSEDYVPPYSPEQLPTLQRQFLSIGSLEDISYVIEADDQIPPNAPFYLSTKNFEELSSAVGVTFADEARKIRFTYSVEIMERGRVNLENIMVPLRFKGGSSLQLHEAEIDIAAPLPSLHPLTSIIDFYRVFDLREHGNHLIEFTARASKDGAALYKYRAYLPCPEPNEEKLQSTSIEFRFNYEVKDGHGDIQKKYLLVSVRGYIYETKLQSGKMIRNPAYRSLLLAEMEFIHWFIQNDKAELTRYECISLDLGYAISRFCWKQLPIN